MAVLMLLDMPGATTEQYDQLNEAMGIHGDEDAPEGLIHHVVGSDENGLTIVDVWESEEAFGRFAEERLRPAVEDVGIQDGPDPRVHPVHNRLDGAGTDAGVIVIIEMDDLTPDVYDQMTSKMDAHAGDGGNHPSVSHTAARTDGGALLVVDVWDSPESFGRFGEEQIGPVAAEANLGPMEPRFVPLHNRITGRAAE
jgi:hypothetical protein